MAQKKRKHGRVEARKTKPLLRFKPGVLLIVMALTFALCFGIFMISAASQEDYWEKEIVADMEREKEENSDSKHYAGTKVNPVPSSERADDSWTEQCAFIGDVAVFSTYYQTTSGKVFTDALLDMSESRMRSIGRSLRGTELPAVYIWYQCPEDLEKGAAAMDDLTDNLAEQMPDIPIYVLTAVPLSDPAENQRVDTWNAALFAMADEKGLYYVDISTTLKANSGTLSPTYEDEETRYKTIGDQILTHVAE